MASHKGTLGFSADLNAVHVPAQKPRKVVTMWLPGLGRVRITKDTGTAERFAREQFATNLTATHLDGDGKLVHHHDLGSGKVTNTGVNMMANDPYWTTTPATKFSTLGAMNYVSTGTGATADAAADVWLQTQGTHFSGGTNSYFTGTQSVTPPNIFKQVTTVNYSGTETVTEWVLCMANAATVARTSAGAAPTQTTFTDTGATFATSGNGLAGYTVEAVLAGSIPLNTATTLAQAQILSNTSTVLTVQAGQSTGWNSLANGAVSNPAATILYVVFPTAWDHRQFTGIGVNSGDSIVFTYSLTITSGG
jgi:hypothetical protein